MKGNISLLLFHLFIECSRLSNKTWPISSRNLCLQEFRIADKNGKNYFRMKFKKLLSQFHDYYELNVNAIKWKPFYINDFLHIFFFQTFQIMRRDINFIANRTQYQSHTENVNVEIRVCLSKVRGWNGNSPNKRTPEQPHWIRQATFSSASVAFQLINTYFAVTVWEIYA